ncbi:MAG: hypothetical protein HY874_08460 [Chloroflexi bacterium]|nr:hypothetical protein [Chloroflexota bacterium]
MNSTHMYTPTFDSCWAKLKRAREHRDSLNDFIIETGKVEHNCPRIGIRFARATGEHVVFVNRMPDLADFLERGSVIIGDVAHNLRSALNHMTYQMALKNLGGQFPNASSEIRVQFPMEDRREMFERRKLANGPKDTGAWIADLCADDQAFIEFYQPGQGQNVRPARRGHSYHPMQALRDISNMDKHRLPVRLFGAPTSMYEVDLGAGMIISGHIERTLAESGTIQTAFLEAGADLFWATMPGWSETNTDMAGYVAPQIALPDGRDVIEVIDRITEGTVAIIAEINPRPELTL